jgi:hypothetical protein
MPCFHWPEPALPPFTPHIFPAHVRLLSQHPAGARLQVWLTLRVDMR